MKGFRSLACRAESLEGAIANLRRLGFGSSFSLLDLIWIAVGAIAAFALASGKVAALL